MAGPASRHKRTKGGDCFILASQTMYRHKDYTLVHGNPRSGSFNKRISHAWCEYTMAAMVVKTAKGVVNLPIEMVYDPSQPPYKQSMPKIVYYQLGLLTEAWVKRYTFKDMIRTMNKYKTYGPWRDMKWADQEGAKRRNQTGRPRRETDFFLLSKEERTS